MLTVKVKQKWIFSDVKILLLPTLYNIWSINFIYSLYSNNRLETIVSVKISTISVNSNFNDVSLIFLNHSFLGLLFTQLILNLLAFNVVLYTYRLLHPKIGLKLQNMLGLFVSKHIDNNSFRIYTKHGRIGMIRFIAFFCIFQVSNYLAFLSSFTIYIILAPCFSSSSYQ